MVFVYVFVDVFIFFFCIEILGLVFLEVMAVGILVVVVNLGGIFDIVINGINGYLFDLVDEKGVIIVI